MGPHEYCLVCALQDAFGDNDVYVVTTIGVGKDDMLKDDAGELCGVVSNRHCPTGLGPFAFYTHCSTFTRVLQLLIRQSHATALPVSNFAEATRLAEGSDDEDDMDDPYSWRSETVDGGGCDPQWFAGGETKSWRLACAPRWVLIRAMDEDLDDDDHIGSGVVNINQYFGAKLETMQTILNEDEELVERIIKTEGRNALEEKVLEKSHEQFKAKYGCSLEQLESGKHEWKCEEWIDVQRETPDSLVDSGCNTEDSHDPNAAEDARKFRERHMEDQKLLCHLLNGGTMEDAIGVTPSEPPADLPM
jgi:hypothetical protein